MKPNKQLLQVLAPYGKWQHAKGLQIVDEIAAKEMKANFEKIFSREIPIYIGHPDEHSQPRKTEQVGRIEKIFLVKNGIVVCANYNEQSYKKILSGEIKNLSPRWEMQPLADGTYRPIRLVSVGLTNNPNIKGSGEIIDVNVKQNSQQRLHDIEKFSLLNAKTNSLFCKAKKVQMHLEKLANKISTISVQKQLNKFNKTNQTTCVKEISKKAIDISLKTGMPYSKAFAKLRKEINVNSK